MWIAPEGFNSPNQCGFDFYANGYPHTTAEPTIYTPNGWGILSTTIFICFKSKPRPRVLQYDLIIVKYTVLFEPSSTGESVYEIQKLRR